MIYPDNFINKVICGNCLEVMKQLPNNSVDSIITSPPFKDKEVVGEYYTFLDSFINEGLRVVKNSIFMLNSATRMSDILRRYPVKRVLIWYKGIMVYSYRYEPIFVFQKSDNFKVNKYIWSDTGKFTPIRGDKKICPHENPIDLYTWLIRISKGDLILEPFTGSGACLIATKKLKKKYIGIEIDPKYCKIARKRLRNV